MFDKRFLSEFAKCFNTSILLDFAKFGESKYFNYIIHQSGLLDDINSETTYLQIYNQFYTLLLSEYRCEYIYKNSIVNQVLIGKHSLLNSTLFSEFRAGNSIADILILNGTSSVYEIKTEYDNLERLNNQITSYFQIFDRINVITFQSALIKIDKLIDKRVGLLTLSDNGEIETIRDPIENFHNVIPGIIFNSLRMPEYKQAIKKYYGYIPNVPNTRIYRECKQLFEKIPPEEAHNLMVEVLKTRKQSFITKLLYELPNSLKMTCLNCKLSQRQWNLFKQVLQKNYSYSSMWTLP